MTAPSKAPRSGNLWLVLSAVFITGLGAGWLGGTLSHRASTSTAGTAEEATGSVVPVRRSGAGGHAPGGGSGREGDAGSRTLPPAKSAEFAEAMRAIFRETDEDRRVAAFDRVLERATPAHLEVLVDLIRANDLSGNGSGAEWSHLFTRWGQTDAPGAFQFLEAKNWEGWDPLASQEARRRTIAAWAQADAPSALAYFERSGALQNGDRLLVYPIVRGLCNRDPEAAMDWLAKTGLARGDEYKAVIDAQRRLKGLEATDAWFDQFVAKAGGRPDDANGLARAILSSRQLLEPAEAAEWVAARKDQSWVAQSDIVQSTAMAYARKDPQAAVEWAQDLQNPGAVAISMSQWLQKNPDDAVDWLSNQKNSPNYGEMVAMSVNTLALEHPDRARQIAETLPQGPRESMLNTVDWIQSDVRARREQIIRDAPR